MCVASTRALCERLCAAVLPAPATCLPAYTRRLANVVVIAWECGYAVGSAADVCAFGLAAAFAQSVDKKTAGTALHMARSFGDSALIVGPSEPSCGPDAFAKALCDCIVLLSRLSKESLVASFRCGVHTGDCIATVVGAWRWSYDVFGATVSQAVALQQVAQSGEICCSPSSTAALRNHALRPHALTVDEARGARGTAYDVMRRSRLDSATTLSYVEIGRPLKAMRTSDGVPTPIMYEDLYFVHR